MAVLKNKNQWINEKILAKEASYLNFLPASDDMKTILEKLTRLKIIKKTQKQGPHYDFYVEFFRKWIVMEITVDMLLKTKEDDSHLHLSPATYT